jgi:carbonic anhydrase
MCSTCLPLGLNRRSLLRGSAFALAAASLGQIAPPAHAAGGPQTNLTPDQALQKLKDGNALFMARPEMCSLELGKKRHAVAQYQAPWATIVCCSDSRVPPELLFGGLGLGELFVVRNAGNMVDTAAMGTIEYGAAVLGSPLLVILGHERCGAVAAACDMVAKGASFPGSIQPMAAAIVPAAQAVKDLPGDMVDNAVRQSARMTAAKVVSTSAIVAERVASGKLKVVAARYDLDDGRVDYL